MSLIVGETAASRYTAFAILDDGALDQRRTWAELDEPPSLGSFQEMIAKLGFAPDGCCLDARATSGRPTRWATAPAHRARRRDRRGDRPAGRPRVYALHARRRDGATLLICAAPDFGEHSRAGQAGGVLFTTEVDVPHAGLP